MNLGTLWWERTPNANRFIRDILKALYMGKSVIINFPENIPWKEEFIDAVEDGIYKYGDEKTLDIHTRTMIKDVKDPGRYLFDNYCDPKEKKNYWTTESYESFLANSSVSIINTKYIILDVIKCPSPGKWIKSIYKYNESIGEENEHGVFILFNKGGHIEETNNNLVHTFNYEKYISEYDCLMLCLTIAADLDCPPKIKQYLAEFATIITNGNYELAGKLCERGMPLILSPYKVVQDVYIENMISYTELSKKVNSALWEAQIKIVFPIIEAYRKYYADKYKDNISQSLPFKDSITRQIIYNVSELEIGHLFYISEKGRFADHKDYKRLQMLKDARNDSSHWNVIEYERLKSIVEYT